MASAVAACYAAPHSHINERLLSTALCFISFGYPSQSVTDAESLHLSDTGVTKDLPDGYHGLVLKPCGQRATAGSDTEQRSWQTTLHFNQLTLWNHDLVPTATDWHNRCIDWLALADKVSQLLA